MHLGRLFQRSVQIYADRPALASGTSTPITYAQLDRSVRALAYLLRRDLGLNPGDRVTLVMRNCSDYAQAMLAAWHAQLCVVPVNNKLHAKEIEFILQDSRSRLCLTDSGLYDNLLPLTRSIEDLKVMDVGATSFQEAKTGPCLENMSNPGKHGELPAWLFYTSGTTGRPKGVVLSHSNLVNMALNFYADVQAVSESDVLLHAAPMSHGSGLYSVPFFLKGALQLVPSSGGFDASETSRLLQQHHNVSLFAAPTMVNRLVKYVREHAIALPRLRTVIVAGAPFYVEDIKRAVQALGPRIAQIYGQGESPMSITAQTASQIARAVELGDDDFLSSVGYPQTSIEISIADGSGHPLGIGQAGEILVAGPTVMQGYWNKPQATEDTLADGKLHTGDVGMLDERGLLYLMDRSKDVIISGGTNIYPREVEEALMQDPRVTEVAVIGIPDPEWGESVLAFVVCQDDSQVTAEALEARCLSQIARFKRPKHYVFIDQMPKNATGKVLKRQLYGLVPQTILEPAKKPA